MENQVLVVVLKGDMASHEILDVMRQLQRVDGVAIVRTLERIVADALPIPEAEELGRFGHDVDPALDFCKEVHEIETLLRMVKDDKCPRAPVEDRIFRAMQFNVGGNQTAVTAKALLRKLEEELKGIAAT